MQDKDIINAYFNRSEQAIAQTELCYGEYCFTIAYRILGDEQEACECVNDAYLRVWDTVPPHRPKNFRMYLATITRHLSINAYKKHHTQKRGNGQAPLVFDELQNCIPSQVSEDQVTDDLVIRECLQRFLQSLSKRDRWVFMRRYYNMDSVSNIAAALKTDENHIYVLLSRSRKKLKELLQKEGIVL